MAAPTQNKKPTSFLSRLFQNRSFFNQFFVQFLSVVLLISLTAGTSGDSDQRSFRAWKWQEVNENAKWSARAGLQVVNHNDNFYVIGGRTPINPAFLPFPVPGASDIWGDVWKSNDYGKTWKQVLATDNVNHWPARAYFQAVNDDNYMYILGGQNFNVVPNPAPPPAFPPFIAQSDFFNDVWRSEDGENWEQMTAAAPWEGRAGLSAVMFQGEIYVMGGSVNDDSSIVGPGGPARIYFNDVWKSENGSDWVQLTDSASWAPRAGGIAVVKDDYLYMIGGEDGFICNPTTPRCPPYFNDVWRTQDGANWELMTAEAEWISRPGHQVVVSEGRLVLFGGFGLGFDITMPANPMDVWVSNDGSQWKQVSSSPWNATGPADIKYDFDAVAVPAKKGQRAAIYSFGGDRETFDFADSLNYLNVDNDVWRYALPDKSDKQNLSLRQNSPNPFHSSTKFSFDLVEAAHVTIEIYDTEGNFIAEVASKNLKGGFHEYEWKALEKDGIYIAKIWAGEESQTIRMILKK